ncbi:MAG: hypothetical protein V9H69_06750 [Anaerolineae bacterium]
MRKSFWYWLAWAILAAAALLGLARGYVGRIALDDAYITYRYAQNLAGTGALVYNPAQPENAFATTAPAYAVLLAGLHRLGADIPWVAAIGGALGILLAAWALGDALRRAGQDSRLPWPQAAGLTAGALLAFNPLLWLVLGMEGLAALGLTLLGFWFANRRQDAAAALLLALAVLLRFDATAAVAAWGLLLLAGRGWRAWRPLALCGGIVAALYGLMHLLLNVPLPSTLASKQAQVALGITGFFPNASYLEGAAWIAAGYWRHAPWAVALLALLALAGLARLLSGWRSDAAAWRATSAPSSLGLQRYALLLLLWAGLHLALYVALGVTPYLWYYLPFTVLLSALAAIGLVALVQRLPGPPRLGWLRPLIFGLLLALLAGGLVRIHQAMQQQVRVYADLPVADPRSAVLPGVQMLSYRQAGEWLAAHTPADATVGVADVGLIGYYSQRPMIDFWGLLDRDVAGALARRDLVWALYRYQPDYLALYGEAPLFGYDIFKDRWFQAAYAPVQRVPAGKVTIYQRQQPALQPTANEQLPPEATPQQFRFGDRAGAGGLQHPPHPLEPRHAAERGLLLASAAPAGTGLYPLHPPARQPRGHRGHARRAAAAGQPAHVAMAARRADRRFPPAGLRSAAPGAHRSELRDRTVRCEGPAAAGVRRQRRGPALGRGGLWPLSPTAGQPAGSAGRQGARQRPPGRAQLRAGRGDAGPRPKHAAPRGDQPVRLSPVVDGRAVGWRGRAAAVAAGTGGGRTGLGGIRRGSAGWRPGCLAATAPARPTERHTALLHRPRGEPGGRFSAADAGAAERSLSAAYSTSGWGMKVRRKIASAPSAISQRPRSTGVTSLRGVG